MSYGLQYPPNFLSSLPTIQNQNPTDLNGPPLRILNAHQYSSLQLNFLLSHPPDHVLFPFLHGLEGDNEAQNLFFAHAGYPSGGMSQSGKTVQVPDYRGLITVLADDEDEDEQETSNAHESSFSQSIDLDEDEDDLEDDLDDEEDEEDFTDSDLRQDPDQFAMDVDVDSNAYEDQARIQDPLSPSAQEGNPHLEGNHMHPVIHRPLPMKNLPKLTSAAEGNDGNNVSQMGGPDELMSSSSVSTMSSMFSPGLDSMPSSLATSVGDPSFSLVTSTADTSAESRIGLGLMTGNEEPPPPSSSPERSGTEDPVTKKSKPLRIIPTCALRPREILTASDEFITPRVPDGISLRNFGIQVPIYATLSDIIIYAPKGPTPPTLALASSLQRAIAAKALSRAERQGSPVPVQYNVFLLVESPEKMMEVAPHLVRRLAGPYCPYLASSSGEATALPHTAVDFPQREKDETRAFTKASEILSIPGGGGQVFLGNAQDVPLPSRDSPTYPSFGIHPSLFAPELQSEQERREGTDPFAPADPHLEGFDLCLECHDMAPFPHLGPAEDHLALLDALWASKHPNASTPLPPRPAPHPNAVIHLPCPSSPPVTVAGMNEFLTLIRFLERCLMPPETYDTHEVEEKREAEAKKGATNPSRRWSAGFRGSFGGGHGRSRSCTTPPPYSSPSSSSQTPLPRPPKRTRALKILLYSADGYTESSVPALILLMVARGLTLPQAYLELQVVRGRSFFVYASDLGSLRRVDARLSAEREGRKALLLQNGVNANANVGGAGNNSNPVVGGRAGASVSGRYTGGMNGVASVGNSNVVPPPPPMPAPTPPEPAASVVSGAQSGFRGVGRRPVAKSVSLGDGSPFFGVAATGMKVDSIPEQSSVPSPAPSPAPGETHTHTRTHSQSEIVGPAQSAVAGLGGSVGTGSVGGTGSSIAGVGITKPSRPRASTSPWLLPGASHHAWFDDPKFDGSFPSRVLPFLYLGNLNHATNAGMLHALGITHVVSVGECALIPPTSSAAATPFSGTSPSLWAEERAGRIHVLDIKGVCDDGIDTLEPQLGPICAYIDHARLRGGHILVHCRVGVSRSATVTIAYVMQYLNISLVDAYLIVRSRRLSVLIQPNMRLLYNLCGWEVRLARERAGGDEARLREELCRALSWPCLAKEVHSLNEKYLHN